jgi:hypothetical protein
MSENNPIVPLPGIPKVRAIDPDGTIVAEGWYAYHINRSISPLGGHLNPEDVDQCIISDAFADWNLPQAIRCQKIAPPTRIEIIKEENETSTASEEAARRYPPQYWPGHEPDGAHPGKLMYLDGITTDDLQTAFEAGAEYTLNAMTQDKTTPCPQGNNS